MMPVQREILVHLTPELVEDRSLRGTIAVAVDVLRASTTIIHALAAGCIAVRPCLEVWEARAMAAEIPKDQVLLGGERHGKRLPDFDLGNSPAEYTPSVCAGKTLVLTTTNGSRAIHQAIGAERILIAAFVNLSAVC